jgi:hypothetical protein
MTRRWGLGKKRPELPESSAPEAFENTEIKPRYDESPERSKYAAAGSTDWTPVNSRSLQEHLGNDGQLCLMFLPHHRT